jgi:hypothetical protein
MDRTTDDPEKAASYLVYEFERRAYPLSEARFTIGRDATSDIIIREPSVSRSHAEVTQENGEFMLRSIGATGTMLNGVALAEPSKLEDGDTIGVGSMEFTFRRGRLPLGVSVVDTLSAEGHDPDAMTKRDTIKSPILGGGPAQGERKRAPFPTALVILVVLLALAVFMFVRR